MAEGGIIDALKGQVSGTLIDTVFGEQIDALLATEDGMEQVRDFLVAEKGLTKEYVESKSLDLREQVRKLLNLKETFKLLFGDILRDSIAPVFTQKYFESDGMKAYMGKIQGMDFDDLVQKSSGSAVKLENGNSIYWGDGLNPNALLEKVQAILDVRDNPKKAPELIEKFLKWKLVKGSTLVVPSMDSLTARALMTELRLALKKYNIDFNLFSYLDPDSQKEVGDNEIAMVFVPQELPVKDGVIDLEVIGQLANLSTKAKLQWMVPPEIMAAIYKFKGTPTDDAMKMFGLSPEDTDLKALLDVMVPPASPDAPVTTAAAAAPVQPPAVPDATVAVAAPVQPAASPSPVPTTPETPATT